MDTLLATEGLAWIIAAAVLSGLVRGFAGFGTALVILPVMGQFMSPFLALTALTVMDLIGPLPKLKSALRDGHVPDVVRLMATACITMPIGLLILGQVAPEFFRYAVSALALIMLGLLVAGVKYRGPMTPPLVFATGGLGGFLGGLVGLYGPPVIFLYMASTRPIRAIRGNIFAYLVFSDMLMMVLLSVSGHVVWSVVLLGVLLSVPYTAGIFIGSALFRPEAERMYRTIAYLIIAGSALSGLPIWD